MRPINKKTPQKTRFAKPNQSTVLKPNHARLVNDITAILLVAVAVIFGIALATYSPLDSCWSKTFDSDVVYNKLGAFGAYFSDIVYYLFGYSSWTIPIGLFYLASFKLLRRKIEAGTITSVSRYVGYIILIIVISGFEFLLFATDKSVLPDGYGGAIGEFLDLQLHSALNLSEGAIAVLLLVVIGATASFVFKIKWLYISEQLGMIIEKTYLWLSNLISRKDNSIEFNELEPVNVKVETPQQVKSNNSFVRRTDSPSLTAIVEPVVSEETENYFNEEPEDSLSDKDLNVLEFNDHNDTDDEVDFSGLDSFSHELAEDNVEDNIDYFDEAHEFSTNEEDTDYQEESVIDNMAMQTLDFSNFQSINDSNFNSEETEEHVPLEIEPETKESASELLSMFGAFAKNSFKMQPKLSAAPSLNSGNFQLPSTDLLAMPVQDGEQMTLEQQQQVAETIENAYKDFNVNIEICNVEVGPVITRYELIPPRGVKGEKIAGFSKEIARSLALESIRIVENIVGKSTMGIEVPNVLRQTIFLREIFDSEQFRNNSSKLTLALGKDIAGNVVVTDLAKMPHLLVAGTTGSGKSVSVNAMILSILYKATPEDVKFIMIDPKMVELNLYQDIPHLLAPVVTDMSQAANALKWTVGEMERRYKIMAKVGTKKITDFNHKIEQAAKNGRPIYNPLTLEDPQPLEKWPFIVVIIDELADLMMTEGKKIEQYIARIAQKARAVGIHLIIATQRPSADVITGLIKTNIPARIAFKIPTAIDSRIILGQQGAETLLGQGDMLFSATGGNLRRIHGAFVDDGELHEIVEFLKEQQAPDYDDEILTGDIDVIIPGVENDNNNDSGVESDPIFDQAVHFILSTKRCSISALQTQFGIGYNKGARIMAHLDKIGMVKRTERGTFELLRHTID